MKNLILLSIAALALFTTQAQSASFEPLGSSRTLGDVYDDLMTVSELNHYIDSQGLSDENVGSIQTYHFFGDPNSVSDIINLSILDAIGSTNHADYFILILKGETTKYSTAIVREPHAGVGLLPYINVYNNNTNYNDGVSNLSGIPLNIATSEPNPVPEPSILYLMLACLLQVGLKRLRGVIPCS